MLRAKRSLLLKPIPTYAFFTKIANVEDKTLKDEEKTFTEKSKYVSNVWKNITKKCKKEFEEAASKSSVIPQPQDEDDLDETSKITINQKQQNEKEKSTEDETSLVKSFIKADKLKKENLRENAIILDDDDDDSESTNAKKKKKKMMKKKKNKKRKLSDRQKYFRKNYQEVRNVPFHSRLAKLHTMYENEVFLSPKSAALSKNNNNAAADRTNRLLASLSKKGSVNNAREVSAAKRKLDDVRMLYRKAVSTSVRGRSNNNNNNKNK